MNADQLISIAVPTLEPADTGSRALDLMETNNLFQLPVVADGMYLGMAQESDILDWPDPFVTLEHDNRLHFQPLIMAGSHPFEAFRLANRLNLSVVPVTDAQKRYLGAITREGLIKYFTENSGIDVPGGIIVLEIMPRNYALHEIARICENEDLSILNLQVHVTETGMMELTLKLNKPSVEAAVASFERHNYLVKEVYGEEKGQEDITDNYNHLMNYLNI